MVPDHDKNRDLCTYQRSLLYIEPQFEPTYRRDDERRDLLEAVLKMAVRRSNRRQEKVPPRVAAGLCARGMRQSLQHRRLLALGYIRDQSLNIRELLITLTPGSQAALHDDPGAA
jgi:hypothetical protein